MLKEIILYLVVLAITAGILAQYSDKRKTLPLPHLATSEYLLLIKGYT